MSAICTVVIFAKAPLPGLAKTRLAPAIGEAAAAQLAARMLEHAVQAAREAKLGPVEICCAPDTSHPAFSDLARQGIALSIQREGDLGLRMEQAFVRVLRRTPHALLIGTDAPQLDAGMLRSAAAALHEVPAVFVPAADGGYALIGLRSLVPRLFSDIPWSTANVLAHTRARLRQAGVDWRELPSVHDIDEPVDLIHLPPGWME